MAKSTVMTENHAQPGGKNIPVSILAILMRSLLTALRKLDDRMRWSRPALQASPTRRSADAISLGVNAIVRGVRWPGRKAAFPKRIEAQRCQRRVRLLTHRSLCARIMKFPARPLRSFAGLWRRCFDSPLAQLAGRLCACDRPHWKRGVQLIAFPRATTTPAR